MRQVISWYGRLPLDFRGLPLALLLGAGGGWLFVQVQFPLAWLLGSVVLTMAGAFARLPIGVPGTLRNGMVLILGLLVGSGFTPDILDHIHRWVVSISIVVGFTVLMLAVTYQILRRVFRMRRLDALFSGLPGGLANVIFVGSELGADLRLLSLMHSIRIVLICFAVPLWFRVVEGVTSSSRQVITLGSITLWDMFWFGVAGAAGYGLAVKLRIPAPFLIGPLLVSAALHMTGFTAASPPSLLVNAAQVVVGSAIGCRFVGVPFRRVLSISGMGVGVSLLLLIASVLTALGTHHITGLPFAALVLAFAPGGLPEMTLIALALNLDVAFVVSHHLARILFINLVFPVLARKLQVRWAGDPPTQL